MKTSAKKSPPLSNFGGFGTQTLPKVWVFGVRRCGWLRWKAEIMLLRFKKNPDEKKFHGEKIF